MIKPHDSFPLMAIKGLPEANSIASTIYVRLFWDQHIDLQPQLLWELQIDFRKFMISTTIGDMLMILYFHKLLVNIINVIDN